jgi:hypothetical protein
VRRLATFGAVASGALIGVLVLAMVSRGYVHDDPSEWLLTRLSMAGTILTGLTLVGSAAVAVYRPRRAGWILLSVAPILGFLLGYPTAGYLVWHEDGSGVFEQPIFIHAFVFACLLYTPFVLAVVFRRNPKRAKWVFFGLTAVVTPLLASSYWAAALAPWLAGFPAPFVLLGGFWLWTVRRGWPPMRVPDTRSRRRAAGFALSVCVTAAVLVVAATFAVAIVRSSLFTADCHGGDHPFLRPLDETHVVVTARILWAGYGLRVEGHPVGDWAIGLVEERFWGLPARAPGIVLLRNNLFQQGQTLFISGSRERGALTRHLPIIDATFCGDNYIRPVDSARIQLRLLRQPPPSAGALILGVVRSPVRLQAPLTRTHIFERMQIYEWAFGSPPHHHPVGHARVRISSSKRTAVVTTDVDGFFEWQSGKPDDYVIHVLDVPAAQIIPDIKVPRSSFDTGFAAVPILASNCDITRPCSP